MAAPTQEPNEVAGIFLTERFKDLPKGYLKLISDPANLETQSPLLSNVSQRRQQIPEPLAEQSTGVDMVHFLYKLVLSKGDNKYKQWDLAPFPIGFATAELRKKWKCQDDSDVFRTYSQWLCSPFPAAPCAIKVAFFCTWAETWVGNPTHWREQPWHAWVAAIRKLENGKTDVYIWDSNTQDRLVDNKIYRNHLLGTQTKLLKMIREQRKTSINQV
jgi:hypothetical protein